MNQSSSKSKSHNQKFSTSAWKDSIMQEKKRKKQQQQQQQQQCSSRKPFQGLNNGGINDSNSNASSLSSIEAPKCCPRFFLSHTSSSSTKTPFSSCSSSNKKRPSKGKVLSTPNSAPNMRPAKENSLKRSIFQKPISQKFDKVKRNPPKSGRNNSNNDKPSLKNVPSLKLSLSLNSSGTSENNQNSIFREVKQLVVDKVRDFDALKLTPLNKVATGSGLNLGVDGKVMNNDVNGEKSNAVNSINSKSTSSTSKTPPIQASVSPEIQCGSSTTAKATTPVCYGAGYVVSGVIDKRKCRPRGILTVGEAKPLDCFDSDDEFEKENTLGPVDNSEVSMLPLPAEASMRWLLSPCTEEDEDQKENSEDGSCRFRRLEKTATLNFPISPLSDNDVFSPDLFSNSTDRSSSAINARRNRTSCLLSPNGGFISPPLYDITATAVLCSGKERKNRYDHDEKSPFSTGSLGSGNIIQTPQSESSTGTRVGISWLNAEDDRKCELSSVSEYLQMASLPPKSHVSIWDPTNSIFQFDCLTSTSNSIDLSHFQKVLNDGASWFSDSTTENVSQSQMRISWREGLVSRIFEMDEFDSCRCLSDEKEDSDASGCKDDSLKLQHSPDLNVHTVNKETSMNGSGCTIFIDSRDKIDTKVEEMAPQELCSCAESISTDGGGLVRSEDSDWTLCYKNHLFQL